MSETRAATRTQATAHRGDSSRFRENTLPAIRAAMVAGAEFVEIDVRITSDGAVVILHDPTLARLWGRPVDIARTRYTEVCELGDRDHRPPLLTEVLELFESSRSTLLIDMDDAMFAEPAYAVTRDFPVEVAWCGDLEGTRTIRALDPAARIWMAWDSPHAPTAKDLAGLAPECVNMDYLDVTPGLVRQIHKLNCRVCVWTVDEETTMRWVRGMGVDAVTTNQLSRLHRVISEDRPVAPVRHADIVDIDAAIAVAHELARWAVDFIRATDPGRTSTKVNPADIVTEVDVSVERRVREVIGRYFPDHGFVGEEMGGAAEPGVPCWYLDPVDGTTNLANSIPWNSFSLALVIDATPLVAVVADPWRGDLFEAAIERGATLNAAPLRIPRVSATDDPLQGRVVSTELAAHLPWPGMIELLQGLGHRYCTTRIMGSGTMTLVGVAAGRGVGAVIGEFGAVDHVAANLIVHEAGGVVLDSFGRPNLFPSNGGIMAAAPSAADHLYRLWQSSCRAAGAGVAHPQR